MKKTALITACLLGLSGCVEPVGSTNASFLNNADAPQYVLTQSGQPISTKCKGAQRGGFGTTPPGCLVDTAFANQVAYPHDMTSPHTPGSTSPRTTAQAASPYLYGEAGSPTD